MSAPAPFQRRSFGEGLRWLPAGAELFATGFGPLAGIASLWLFVSLLGALIPFLGQLLLVLFTPLLTAGVLFGFDRVARGEAPSPMTLFAGWQDPGRRARLLLLGALSIFGSMLAAAVLVGWIGSQIDPSELEAAMSSPQALAEALAGASIGPGLLLAVVLFGLVLAALFFAIPLVMFLEWPVLPALWMSLRASLANWLAFLGFGLAFLAVAMGLGVIMAIVTGATELMLGQFGVFVIQVLILLITLLVQMLMAGAQYVAFRQIFGLPADPKGDDPDPGGDDRLVA